MEATTYVYAVHLRFGGEERSVYYGKRECAEGDADHVEELCRNEVDRQSQNPHIPWG